MNKEKIINIIKLIIVLTIFFSLNFISNAIISIFKIDTQAYQLTISILVEIVYIIALFILYRKDSIKEAKTFKNNKKEILIKSFTYWFYGFMGMCISNVIITKIIGEGALNEVNIRNLLKDYPIYVGISTVILAPIIEEFVFRKSFRKVLNNKWIYIGLTSLFFASLHITATAEVNPLHCLYLIPYASMGIAFSYMNVKTDSIYSSITLHMMHNLLTLITALVQIGAIL